jgi:hypothetical protein
LFWKNSDGINLTNCEQAKEESMRKRHFGLFGLVVGFLLIGFNLFAADGDLIVNGSVGIGGTTSPDRKLEVVDSSNPQMRLTNQESVYTDLETTANGHLYVNPSGGNVGIGTTGPTVRLDVSYPGSPGIRSINSNAPASGAGGGIVAVTGTPTAADQRLGWLGFGGITTGTTYNYASRVEARSGEAWNSTHAGSHLLFFTTPLTTVTRTEKMRITDTGNVGIGNTSPTHLLTMEPDATGYYGALGEQGQHGWVYPSSARWKSDVRPIAGALDTVLKLNGVSFKWKKRTDIFETTAEGEQKYVSSTWEDDPSGRDEIGLIGEDVMKVLPEVVDADQKDSNFAAGVAYSKIVALLIEAMKEQQKTIEDLRAEVDLLRRK